MKHFKFLESTRFWAIVAFALAMWLNDLSLISENLFGFIATVCGGHIGIRTIDRFGEQGVNSK